MSGNTNSHEARARRYGRLCSEVGLVLRRYEWRALLKEASIVQSRLNWRRTYEIVMNTMNRWIVTLWILWNMISTLKELVTICQRARASQRKTQPARPLGWGARLRRKSFILHLNDWR